jgi:hypothetical protein
MSNLKEWRICMKFCFKLGKTALEMHEMLKTAFGDSAMGRTQTFEWFSQFKHGLNIKSMLVIFFDCDGIFHQEFVPPGQTVNHHLLPGGLEAPEGASLLKTSGMMVEPGLVASP